VSLNGSVEDLPLLEILQVVSYCQKTGHLTVQAPGGEAAIVFDSGRIVSGYAWDVPPLPQGEAAEAAKRESVVRQRITTLVERLVRLRDGHFAFNLTQGVPGTLGGRDLSGETLPYGINPEELMLDLARKLDEDRRDTAAALGASFVTPPEEDDVVLEELPPEEPSEPRAGAGPTVLLVDDEPEVRRVLGARLSAAGFQVAAARGPAEARQEMERLAAERTPFLLLADVGLPSEAGTSFRGGLDVARHASGLASPPPVLLMAETIDEKLRSRARRAGASLLAFKPGLSKLDPRQYESDLRAFGDKLARDLLPRLEGRRVPAVAPAPGPRPPATPAGDESARAALLRGALDEMTHNPDPDLVAFLLLRAARVFFPRVVLFLVRDEQLRGLAGFGPLDGGLSLDLLARELSVPLEPPSPFSEAVAVGRAWSGPLPVEGPLRGLVDRLGSLGTIAAAVVPVRAHHETIAVVYGDAPDGGALPAIAPLVEFTEQAGRALDAAFLARRAPARVA
jgi:CheY-like chemotaxis protein